MLYHAPSPQSLDAQADLFPLNKTKTKTRSPGIKIQDLDFSADASTVFPSIRLLTGHTGRELDVVCFGRRSEFVGGGPLGHLPHEIGSPDPSESDFPPLSVELTLSPKKDTRLQLFSENARATPPLRMCSHLTSSGPIDASDTAETPVLGPATPHPLATEATVT